MVESCPQRSGLPSKQVVCAAFAHLLPSLRSGLQGLTMEHIHSFVSLGVN